MKRTAETADQKAGKKRAAKRAKSTTTIADVAEPIALDPREEEEKQATNVAGDEEESSSDSSSSSSLSSSSENNMTEDMVRSGDEDDGGIYLNNDKEPVVEQKKEEEEEEEEEIEKKAPATKGRAAASRKKKAAPAKEPSEDEKDDDGDDDDDDTGVPHPNSGDIILNTHAKPGTGAIGRFTRLCKDWEEQRKFPKNMVPNLYRLFRIIDRASQGPVNDYLGDNARPVVGSFENDERKLDMTVQARAFINNELETKLTEITYLAGLTQDQANTERLDPASIRQAIQSRPHLRAFDMEALLVRHTHMAPVINSLLADMLASHANKENNTIFLDYEHTLPDENGDTDE